MQREDLVGLLLACLHRDPARLDRLRLAHLDSDDWNALLGLAAVQRVAPLLARRLSSLDPTEQWQDEAMQPLREHYKRNVAANLRLQGQLRGIARALHSAGIPLIALKGIFLAPIVYHNLGLREMNDIDIMVPRDQIRAAHAVFVALGYAPLQAWAIDNALASSLHLDRLIKPNAASVEIHWNITRPNLAQSIDPAELWQRAVPARLAGVDVLAFGPEDLLLHLCLHTSYHHQFGFGLRPSCDIAVTIDQYAQAIAWEQVVRRAEQRNWRGGVYLALHLAQELVGANVPAEVLRALKPRDFDERVARAARRQVFDDQTIGKTVSGNLTSLWMGQSLAAKGRVLVGALLPSRASLARELGIPHDSRRIYLHYLLRPHVLLQRNRRVLWSLLRGDRELATLADTRHILREWLSRV